VHQPAEVVEGPAELRGEFRGPGVHQVEGQDELGHLPLVDLIHQIIKGQEVGISPGGDGKAGGDGQADLHGLAQVGILAPHPIHHVLVHLGQGQDRVGEGEFLFFP